MKNKKGFTLAELLIVVAIIGVLVAISIPIFTSQLEKARIAVDQANVRSAKAAAVAEWITSGQGEQKYYYNAATGQVQTDPNHPAIKGYGKYTKSDKEVEIGATNTPNKNGTANYITLIVSEEGNVLASWGSAYGSLWRTSVKDVGTTQTNNWTENKELYNKIKNNLTSEQRKNSDIDVLNGIAEGFVGKSVSEVKEILGENNYNRATSGNCELFKYGIDNTSYSIHISYFGEGIEYLEDLGYDIQPGKTTGSGMTQNLYMKEYLFSSDDVLNNLGKNRGVGLKIKTDGNMVTSAEVWLKDMSSNDYRVTVNK